MAKGLDEIPKNDSKPLVETPKEEDSSDDDDDDGEAAAQRRFDEDDDDEGDPFRGGYLGGNIPHASMSSTLRALSGYVSGVSQRLRDILNNLRQKDDPSVQLIALQELSEILLVSNEDNLSGHFSPDQFIKELVTLMQPSEYGEENPEMMLLACRCIANLMEALPPSTANVVYGGAVPILCQKLLEIHFIDLAEQALSTLEKISMEFPSAIVREGGLTGCLAYLDFFATSTQRTAVTTAANCCKNIPQDSFPVVKEVMPILLNVLSSSDQKVVEQGSICVSRVVESFKYQHDKLEELVSTGLLKAIRRLLQPGTTNLIGPNIHTQFLRVLSIAARASPRLSAELLRMDIVDTLYQILTGISPPSGLEDVASQIDGVFIMQALIHRPREQISETLNVICELLPEVQTEGLSFQDDSRDAGLMADGTMSHIDLASRSSHNSKRVELLKGCKEELKRFAIVLFPTLTDAYSSTVNLVVRQKVLLAQLKMVSNLDSSILEDALRTVPYASYLASILSQEDHPSLVTSALKASDLLLNRLSSIYGYQFYREGVMAEVSKLASKSITKIEHKPKVIRADLDTEPTGLEPPTSKAPAEQLNDKAAADAPSEDDSDHDEDDEDDDANDDDEDDEPRVIREDISPSPSDSSSSSQTYPMHAVASEHDLNILRAKKFLEVHETAKGKTMHDRASAILEQLTNLAADIEKCYLVDETCEGAELFTKLSTHFQGDALETITSSELLHSEIVRVLLDVFSSSADDVSAKARTTFLEVFMTAPTQTSTTQSAPPTPFSIFVHKLQDLLSRAEHFEVVTVHHNALDNNRSSPAAMLSKQLRLKLLATDDDAEMPRPYKNLMISIHAIATFKALDDYLRPRISLSDRPRSARHREGVSNALAAFAAAAGIPNPHHRLAERGGTASGDSPTHPTPPDPATPARATRKGTKSKNAPAASDSTPVKDKPTSARRSSRKHQPEAPSPADAPAPAPAPERVQSPLECADERQISDDDDDIDDSSALDAIVDDLEDGIEGEQAPEPTAVNMEIASTGKVTARKEDGTRVATPSQGSVVSLHGPPSARSRELLAAGINSSSSGRAMSYAAAIQAVPQDWHIEFSINGQPLPNETTIYGAVLNNKSESADSAPRNIWSAIHTVNFKRVPGPPPAESTSLKSLTGATSAAKPGMPPSLHEHPATSKILRLLNILHEMNANLDDVLDDSKSSIDVKAEPVAQFVNTKLTAKLNRQLEEPLIVASNCLPSWSEDLARLYPFLFPFETRHLFLQSTSFGYARSMTRWQNQSAEENRRERHRDDRPFMGRLQRQKVRISRSRMLDSAMKVMELYGGSSSVLEVEYFEEVGTGLGPTLEFYSTVSKEFSKKSTKLWRENDANENDEYAFGKLGMFPAPMNAERADSEAGKKILNVFKMLGKFIARSMLDSRIIDVSLNPTFFRIGDQPSTVPLSLGAVKTVDSQLAKSLRLLKQYAVAKKEIDGKSYKSAFQKAQAERKVVINGAHIEDLGLDFTLPGYPAIELIPDGGNTLVTLENVASYVEKVIDMTLGSGVQRQVDHFRLGFSEVFPYTALKAFTPSELVMLFGRVEEDWSIETLLDSIKADHGFNMDSKSVRNLLQTMSELSAPQRRDFLQFVTGSPKLPIGGQYTLLHSDCPYPLTLTNRFQEPQSHVYRGV